MAAVESQLLEIIGGLELMNYEWVDKVKSAKRTEQAAIKLHNNSKEVASRRLDKLVLEKEEKNQLKDELTHVLKAHDAQQKSLQEYKAMVKELRSTQGILDKLHNEKKATWKYLSISGSPLSYQGCPEEVKEGLRGLEATNNRSKNALGGRTHQVQKYGRIGITNAAAVSDAKRNGYFSLFSTSGNTMKGMFHQFKQRMGECLLTVAIEDAPVTISINRDDLDK
jgi:hypothetical protein